MAGHALGAVEGREGEQSVRVRFMLTDASQAGNRKGETRCALHGRARLCDGGPVCSTLPAQKSCSSWGVPARCCASQQAQAAGFLQTPPFTMISAMLCFTMLGWDVGERAFDCTFQGAARAERKLISLAV